MTAGRVLFVGSRTGAWSAAARLGLDAFVLYAKPLPPAAARAARGAAPLPTTGGAKELVAAARELLGGRAVDAVVATAEGCVIAAARLREAFGLPGAGVDAALRCTDKLAMKRAASEAGIACAEWEEVGPDARPDELLARLGTPLVLKPARSSGGRGLSLCEDVAAVRAALARCTLAERFVEGREMSVESIFADGRTLFANPTEYLVRRHANVVPARLDSETWSAVRELSERVVRAMGLGRGMAHVELFLTERGPVFGEIAARPPGGRLMTLIRAAYGFDPWDALLRVELGELPELPSAARGAAGTWMLHPGAGRVLEVAGREEAEAVPGVVAVRCRVRPGDLVPPREGSGQDVGHIEVRGTDRDAAAEALLRAHEALRIRVGRT